MISRQCSFVTFDIWKAHTQDIINLYNCKFVLRLIKVWKTNKKKINAHNPTEKHHHMQMALESGWSGQQLGPKLVVLVNQISIPSCQHLAMSNTAGMSVNLLKHCVLFASLWPQTGFGQFSSPFASWKGTSWPKYWVRMGTNTKRDTDVDVWEGLKKCLNTKPIEIPFSIWCLNYSFNLL